MTETTFPRLMYSKIDAEEYKKLSAAERTAARYNEEEGNLNEQDGYDCPICKNKGFYFTVNKDKEVSVKCQCMNIRLAIRRASNSGILENLKRYSFKNYQSNEEWQKNLLERAFKYAKNPEGWFYISGAVGSGKTFLCTAIIGWLIRTMNCQYMMWREDSVKLKASVMNAEEYAKKIDVFKNADVLYIDDFLKGKITEADVNLAYEIVNARYNSRKITLFSSEKRLGAVIELDEALGSRIYELSKKNIIHIENGEGKNFRLKK